MNPFTQLLHLVGSGAAAYITARNLRDLKTRPDMLAGLQLAEAGAVPFLETLSKRAAAEGDTWLADSLLRHAQDERRHSQIFTHALKQLNKHVDLSQFAEKPDSEKSNSDSENRRRSPFLEAYYRGYSKADLAPDRIDWMVFFLSTHILELDASRDFLRMAAVLPDTDTASASLKKGLISIAQDEQRHAAYLLEAAQRRASYAAVQSWVDEWRERKVNAIMAMVGNLLQNGDKRPSLVRDGVPAEMVDEAIEPELTPA